MVQHRPQLSNESQLPLEAMIGGRQDTRGRRRDTGRRLDARSNEGNLLLQHMNCFRANYKKNTVKTIASFKISLRPLLFYVFVWKRAHKVIINTPTCTQVYERLR